MLFRSVLLILILVPASACAGTYLDSTKLELFLSVQNYLYNDDFLAADSLSRVLIEKYSTDPAGRFLRAATLLDEMFDREENLNAREFHLLLDTVVSLASKTADTSTPATAAWMALYLGHAKSYRSLWESRFGSFTKAIKLGMDVRNEYEKGLVCDSTRYDLYLGLGLYHYWKSAKGGILCWLHILKNEKTRGIRELRLAADSSVISRESARNALIWVWLDRKEFDSAIALCRQMLHKYPDGKVFLWPLAEAYLKKRDFAKAIGVYQTLRDRWAVNPGNHYNLIECDYQLYRCYDATKMKAKATEIARRAKAYLSDIPRETGQRQRTKIAFLKRAARL